MHQNQGERGCKSEGVGRDRKKERQKRGKRGRQKHREEVMAKAKMTKSRRGKVSKKDHTKNGANTSKPGVWIVCVCVCLIESKSK